MVCVFRLQDSNANCNVKLRSKIANRNNSIAINQLQICAMRCYCLFIRFHLTFNWNYLECIPCARDIVKGYRVVRGISSHKSIFVFVFYDNKIAFQLRTFACVLIDFFFFLHLELWFEYLMAKQKPEKCD